MQGPNYPSFTFFVDNKDSFLKGLFKEILLPSLSAI
jgi:hypothetical protein